MIVPDPTRYGEYISIKQMKKECYESAQTQMYPFWNEYNLDLKYAVGDQRTVSPNNNNYTVQKFVFNVLHAHKEAILGHQRKTRKSSIAVPIEDRDQQLADDFSGTLIWTMKADNMLHKISDAFGTTLVGGLTMIHNYIDYTHDPVNGKIKIKPYAPTQMITDPWWREPDLSDCRFVWIRDYVNLQMLNGLLPDYQNEIKYIPRTYESSLKFTFMPEAYQVKRRKKNNYAYDQFYYLDDRQATLIHSFDRGETYEIKGDEDTRRMWIDLNFSPEEKQNIKEYNMRIPCIRLAISVNDKVLYDEYHRDRYPFTPMMAYFAPDSLNYSFRHYGIIRTGRDSQYLFNRKMNIQLQVLESLPNSGVNVVEDALIDKNDAFKNGPNQVRVIKKGYNPAEVIQNIVPPTIDPAALKITDDLAGLARTLIGINDELMGMADNSDVGITEVLRQGASLTTLQTLFDNLDLAQKMISLNIMMDIQENYSPSLVKRILGRDPHPDFFNVNMMKFDVEVTDGLNTATQKQMQFANIIQLAEMGVPISNKLKVQSSQIQNKKDVIEDMQEQEEQMKQMQMQKHQSEMVVAEANSRLLDSQSKANEAAAYEKMSKIETNHQEAVEKRAKALDDADLASLHKIEALKKLQELDLGNLEKYIMILKNLQEKSQTQEVGDGI